MLRCHNCCKRKFSAWQFNENEEINKRMRCIHAIYTDGKMYSMHKNTTCYSSTDAAEHRFSSFPKRTSWFPKSVDSDATTKKHLSQPHRSDETSLCGSAEISLYLFWFQLFHGSSWCYSANINANCSMYTISIKYKIVYNCKQWAEHSSDIDSGFIFGTFDGKMYIRRMSSIKISFTAAFNLS